jgi:4-aminobutyrate aminotransferase-like enzyme
VLKVIREEGLQENALATGAYLKQGLTELSSHFPLIGDVRGSGLFLGIELVSDPLAKTPAAAATSYIANRMRTLGILMSTDGPDHNVLKIKPPMVFGKKQADFLLGMLERVMGEDGTRTVYKAQHLLDVETHGRASLSSDIAKNKDARPCVSTQGAKFS